MNENCIKNRSELIFIYDVKNANPNGDPDENKPRMDEETETNIVTDVRLKRTIRDYLANFKKENIFIIEEKRENETQKSRARRLAEFIIKIKNEDKSKFKKWDITPEELRKKKDSDIEKEMKNKIELKELESVLLTYFTDIRLFGATIAVKESTITKIGPVQFKFGKSLHKVEPVLIRGTTVLPSKEDVKQGTFTEMWIVPYSLLCFYGVINENAAKSTGLKEEDVKLLLDGMWNGTKNLITRSKAGQIPRFLLRVIYKEDNYHIGDLDQKIKLLDEENKTIDKDGKRGKEIRSISEVKLDITELIEMLGKHKEKIAKIEYEVNDEVKFVVDSEEIQGKDIENKLKSVCSEVSRLNLE